jgi:hypothetical protein
MGMGENEERKGAIWCVKRRCLEWGTLVRAAIHPAECTAKAEKENDRIFKNERKKNSFPPCAVQLSPLHHFVRMPDAAIPPAPTAKTLSNLLPAISSDVASYITQASFLHLLPVLASDPGTAVTVDTIKAVAGERDASRLCDESKRIAAGWKAEPKKRVKVGVSCKSVPAASKNTTTTTTTSSTAAAAAASIQIAGVDAEKVAAWGALGSSRSEVVVDDGEYDFDEEEDDNSNDDISGTETAAAAADTFEDDDDKNCDYIDGMIEDNADLPNVNL